MSNVKLDAAICRISGHTSGPWEWWTSNSWRRLTSVAPDGRNRDGGVLCPVVSRSDGHPDVSVSEADMGLIAAAPEMLAAGIEIDRLGPVIESAVRNADKSHHAEVLVALEGIRNSIAKAKTPVIR